MSPTPEDSYVTLHTGAKMPKLGLGTWAQTNVVNRDQHNPQELANAVKTAIEHGYRHIDTAWAYFNEKEIGDILKGLFAKGDIKREDVFVTTKLFPFFFEPEVVEQQVRKQLADLQLDYIDMLLMHGPIPMVQNPKDPQALFNVGPDGKIETKVIPHLDTWKALEGCVKKGLLKHIGVSNFSSKQVQNLLDHAEIKPANNQVECHAYFPQTELLNYCQDHGVAFTAYSPLGSPGSAVMAKAQGRADFPILLKDPVVAAIAEKHKKTAGQVLIRYQYDRGCVVIPKSTNPERIKQNFDIFDFKLSEDEIKQLTGLKQGRLLGNMYQMFKDHPQNPLKDDF